VRLTTAEDVFDLKPDGVFSPTAPAIPEHGRLRCTRHQEIYGRVPVFGICLGHQLTGLALGGKTYKLKSATTAATIRLELRHRQGGDHGP